MNIALTQTDFAALSPLLILLGGALLALLVESFGGTSTKKSLSYIVLAVIGIALLAAIYAPSSNNTLLTPWIRFDSLAKLFTIFFLAIGLGSSLLAIAFFQRFQATHGEYYFLLLSSVIGLILIGTAADFLTLFIGIETLSIALYVLCGYMKDWKLSNEAAMKYFFIGAIAAAFLLYGIALIYGAIGTTRFDLLMKAYQTLPDEASKALFYGGIALITLGLAFKAAIVPFHAWAPDVYDGAPTPVTAFMAVGTKVGAFAALSVIFLVFLPHFDVRWNEAIAWLAYPTLIYANYVALREYQLRRFFAYSGISHAGFLLIPLAAGGPEALPALLFYLVIYSIATLGSFAVLAFIDTRSEGVMMQDLRGLFRRSPFFASVLALCLLTLAGIPPTPGFFAKFYVFKLAFQTGYYGLVVVGLLTTILSAFYYLRFVAVMFSDATENATVWPRSWPTITLGLASLIAIVFLSFYPSPLMNLLAVFGTG